MNETAEAKDVTAENKEQKADESKSAETAEESTETVAETNQDSANEESAAAKSEEKPQEEVKSEAKADNSPVEHNPDAFDWSIDKEGFATYDKSERQEMVDMYANTINQIEEKTLVQGRVVSFTDSDVVLDIGFKSDGLVARTEFRDMPDLKVGDEVEVFVDQTENELGQLVLSRKKAVQEGAWEKILHAKEHNEILNGYIRTRTKGGLVVDVLGMDAFLPGSQIDVKPVRDYDQYVGKTMEFKVVKVNELYKNVVISHKALIEDDIEAQKAEMISKLEVGQILEGTVKNMTSFGVFVDLGGLDGLLHITDISWGRINHPEDVLELDQKVKVVVLEFDDDKKRISLGMKQLTPHPWENMKEELKAGDKVKGKVVTVADYGAFIEIEPGIEGLIHVSEMSWSQHLRNPSDFMTVGDEVEAVVLDIDKEEHKLSLGLKQLTTDPWEKIEEKYPMDSKHTGIVRNLTNYGLFIELEEGVDGLVHVSDLSWSKKIKHPAEFTKKGEELEVVVLEIDRDNRRLSLGHKQIDENPWDTFESIFTIGSEHEGTITEINDRGAIVSLPYGVEGFAPKKHTKKEDKSEFAVEETATFRVIEFNKDAKRILVSHTDIWKESERAQKADQKTQNKKRNTRTSKFVDRINQQVERTTLGEFDVLSELKAKFEAEPEKEAKKKPAAKKETAKKETPAKEETPSKEEASAEEVVANAEELMNHIGGAAEEADDLKKINGIGPAYEKKLNEMGINSYAQMSKLDKNSIKILEALTKWPGRVERDDWVGQAKELAK
ncbi:30S ribosomal protein S1 [bacterium]|nr:30S ribosomal protein S1 [bacterium]